MNAILAFFFTIGLLVAIGFALVRILKGPSLADRVVAFDLLAALFMGQLIIWSVTLDNPFLLEVAAVIALVGFLATVALSRYLELRKP